MLLHPVPFIANSIPSIFANISENYMFELMQKVKVRADLVISKLQEIPELSIPIPEGSLYCMINVDLKSLVDIPTTIVFARKLSSEKGVLVLPAEALMGEGGFRIVLCPPLEVLEECLDRIKDFIIEHRTIT